MGLEADRRIFAGVGLVVTKLLLQALPDVAIFGEKDYQQLLVIRRIVRDLDIPGDCRRSDIREADGLAMSSRNSYLSSGQREIAGRLNLVLRELAEASTPDIAEAKAHDALLKAGFSAVDYARA